VVQSGWSKTYTLISWPPDTSGLKNATSLGFSSPYHPGATVALRKYLGQLSPKPDVIHAHLFPTSACVAALKKMGAIICPIVFTEHNTSNKRREKPLYKSLDRAIYSQFEKIYCISEGTKTSLLSAYSHLANKTEVILNGAALRFDEAVLREPSLPTKILSVGRLSQQKNYPAALEAISQLNGQNIKYTILGEGDDRAQLEELVKSLGLSDKVAFGGHKSDITPFLEDTDIFLMPSLWEGFGLAAVEGMNAGLPVVASDVSGLREIVGIDGTCAILVPPMDPLAIAVALMEMIQNPPKRHSMGRAAFQRSKLFDKGGMAKKYIKAYQQIVVQEAEYA